MICLQSDIFVNICSKEFPCLKKIIICLWQGMEEKMAKTKEQKQRDNLERIENFRLLDDDFMTACFQDNIEGAELLVQIIMNNKELRVTDVQTQYTIKNIHGRSARLDVYATDDDGKKYNFEIQRADKGAGAKRARLNSALIDGREIPAGLDPEELPETYVIFITERDILKKGLPLYHIDRRVRETGELFPDEAHIIYVNSEVKDNTELGRLMWDFACKNPDDMHYEALAERVRYFKKDEKGVQTMCKAMEDRVFEEKVEIVENLLKLGKLSDKEIADSAGLEEGDVLKIKESLYAPA